jgi:hypothetical protein
MFTYNIKKATTDVSVVIRIIDSTDGTPETSVVWNTAGIDMEYRREGAVSVDITEATLALLSTAHTDGGFLHIGNGYYRLDLPDAACATGADGVLVHGTVTGMVVIGCYIHLVDYDPFDSVRMGVTALPNAAADAAGGLPISDLGGLDLDTLLDVAVSTRLAPTVAGRTLDVTAAGNAGIDWANIENPTTAVDLSGTDIQLADTVTALTGHTAQTGDSFARIGVAGAGLTNINLPNQTMDIIGNITGNLSGSVGSIDTGGITAGSFAAGAIDAAAIAADAIGASEFAAGAAQKIRDEILPTQNAAFNNMEFLFVAASDHVTPVTGASGMAVTRSIDGGAFGAGTGTGPAEVGNGIYQYDASAADMNGGVITFRFTATGGTPGAPDDTFITIVTGGGV